MKYCAFSCTETVHLLKKKMLIKYKTIKKTTDISVISYNNEAVYF